MMYIKIGYFVVFLPFVIFLVFLGYRIAFSAFDFLENGDVFRGIMRFGGGVIVACGSAILLPAGGYWFAFEGGLSWIIGLLESLENADG